MVVKLSDKEKVVEAELTRRVEALGGYCVKVRALGTRGFFDRLVVLPGGRVFFVELKRPRGYKITEHQRQYHRNFTALGAVVAVVKTSADIDALLKS